MARKEINVFNVSFLDLLSGALGAVLILFIIIPKLTSDIERQLEELEQIKELKVDVGKIKSLMQDIKSSVPEAQFNELESRMSKLETTITDLELEVKSLQNKLAECDEQRTALREKQKKLEQTIKELEDRLKNHDKIVEQLKKEVENLKGQLAQCEDDKRQLESKIQELEGQVKQLAEQKEDLEGENKQLNQDLKKAQEKIQTQSEKIAQYEQKLGFEFKDKNVVFVVDVSGSMDDAPEPQKLDEVKAGIKMMIATMSNDYRVDVVIFPKSKDERYGYKYGSLKKVTEDVKYDIYNYLSGIKAHGCTPTRDVMKFVLESPNYADAGTVIYLSDGLPTKRISETECDGDDVPGVESFIKNLNGGKRVINCIGVGKDFRTRASADPKVQFMQNIASQNGGFYIGF